MLAILFLTTIGAVPGQAPPPPQGPALFVVATQPKPPAAAKTCLCTPSCSCGCNAGQVCDCPVTRGVAHRLPGNAVQPRAMPVAMPVVVPQVYSFRPAMQSLYTQPQPAWSSWGGGGGACVGGG